MAKTVSLCLIAKNEEKHIARCINSAKPFVDQIVVVDTGSTDHTAEIAESLGAEVYHHIWQDDFALARNQSLSYATGDWIIFLDCDEELAPATAPLLRQVIQDDYYQGYWVKIVNFYDNRPSTSFIGFRLFRNSPRHRFEIPIHEQILPAVIRNSSPEKIGQSDITIYHYGYENDQEAHRNKIQRNLRILHKAMRDYGQTGFLPFYLGVEYQKLGDYQKALAYYQISLPRTPLTESYAPALVRGMAFCLLSLKQYQAGIDLIDHFLQVYPDYTDLVFLKGAMYAAQENIPAALACMNRCLAMGPPPGHLFSSHGIGREKPLAVIKDLTEKLLHQAAASLARGECSQVFLTLNTVLEQLTKTPYEEGFHKMIEIMLATL
ncbi:glycosyltransferase family 2 protein [Desulforamulus hydrothermalis]|uniref:Glycosyl transferase, family 2 n=1 Tax=Desulforamulus hydrothermalis Lam5 = DSM 18033 TaxID=1121428 RepID=K8DXS3_9FIRM|nr:glycosyltransferase family 2 protein [Desulforamulus hydrothermalis]CCO07380.1 Glycosyl transferase, family 2 [Desulforamulus hydrothermalis Lam5 = DSM 18033]SHH41544.1 Glycosyltransferase involved in cell wall bisynthesis [Desulforamulus hydrothermalis Lam5 = DSM 18033]